MGVFGFVNNMKLSKKVKKDFDPFFRIQKEKINTYNYMDEIPKDIIDIYNEIINIQKFEISIDEYKNYNEIKDHHNVLLKSINDKINMFSFDEILKSPKSYNYDEIVNDFADVFNKINSFIEIDSKMNKFKCDYQNFKLYYSNIVNQYDNIKELKDIINTYKNKYIDNNSAVALKKCIDEKNELLNKQERIFYNIDYLKSNDFIKNLNKEFVKSHINDDIFNNINGKSLDKEQRISVLVDSKSNLTIAGAGSGKTLTICGKVKYLLESLNVSKNDILLLSYSNKSAQDLKNKVNQIASDMNVYTFHALGLDILTKKYNKKFVVDDSFNAVIEKYFREYLKSNAKMLRLVFTYYSLYLSNNESQKKYKNKGELFEQLKKNDFYTLREQLEGYNTSFNKTETIKKELVKSFEELAIANYLFINGIDYEYETTYKEADTSSDERRQYTPDFYFPKYHLYYEHYGIDKNCQASQYEEQEAEEYIASIEWKRQLHTTNNTKCIETYSYEFNDGTIFAKLEQRLKEYGVEFKPLSQNEIYNALNSIYEGKEFKSFINIIRTFISLYKAKYQDENTFDKLKEINLGNKYENKRTEIFIEICKDIYSYYIQHLNKEDKIDFDDMILRSIVAVDTLDQYKYKYIIVDEFQDISYSRMKFLKKLIEHGNSKLYAVGDDWQAIYRFSGCDVNIFLNFKEYFEDSRYCLISSTHRNSMELQNIAEPFITTNPEQYKKNVKSDIHLDKPIKLFYFDDNKYHTFISILADIAKKDSNANILLLGRNNRDIETIESNNFYRESKLSDKYISKDFPNMNIKYSTVHASKGLEEDYVIIINADDNRNGFPNKIEDDILLNLVLSSKSKFLYAEERRLWYVALTRTRTYTYILANINSPSIFVKEIINKLDIINKTENTNIQNQIYCPKCKSGHLIIRESSVKYKKFYGCSNFPYCKYTNDDIKQVNSNHRCKVCGDFMTFRRGPHGSFWGCKNYPNCTYTEQYVYSNEKNRGK